MKKIIALIMTLAMLACLMASCGANNNTPTTTTEPAVKVSVSGGITALEYYIPEAVAGGPRPNANHVNEATVLEKASTFIDEEKEGTYGDLEFQGMSFSIPYLKTAAGGYYGGDFDFYREVSDNGSVSAVVSRHTGKVVRFSATELRGGDGEKLTQDQCREIARDELFNGNYVDDPEAYTITKEHNYGSSGSCFFTFTRVINGIPTYDEIKIFVSGVGNIYAIHANYVGTMANVDVSEIDITAVENAVKAKVEAIYSDYTDITITENDMKLVRTKDNTFFFSCEVNLTMVYAETGKEWKDYCTVHVALNG